MNRYMLHWLDGKVEVIEGESAPDAFTKAGYGGGVLSALDYYELYTGVIT